MPLTDSGRPLRLCEACGGLDDHPHHVVDGVDPSVGTPSREFLAGLPDGTPALAIAEALVPNRVMRHIDCCAAAGCAVCQTTEAVTGGKRGQKLRDAIQSAGVLDAVELPEVTDNKELGIDG